MITLHSFTYFTITVDDECRYRHVNAVTQVSQMITGRNNVNDKGRKTRRSVAGITEHWQRNCIIS